MLFQISIDDYEIQTFKEIEYHYEEYSDSQVLDQMQIGPGVAEGECTAQKIAPVKEMGRDPADDPFPLLLSFEG
ncbi:hypothetical protein E3N88_11810 [Mikania micrantha]|uniref:Uncharacterized protein n=1 Tax=Mikania micrantha TaxID=192012 RepID=A0A5N6P5I7_9ASTR|nr:hypothetical protein E3N88_11810 [Mikania micrantha]